MIDITRSRKEPYYSYAHELVTHATLKEAMRKLILSQLFCGCEIDYPLTSTGQLAVRTKTCVFGTLDTTTFIGNTNDSSGEDKEVKILKSMCQVCELQFSASNIFNSLIRDNDSLHDVNPDERAYWYGIEAIDDSIVSYKSMTIRKLKTQMGLRYAALKYLIDIISPDASLGLRMPLMLEWIITMDYSLANRHIALMLPFFLALALQGKTPDVGKWLRMYDDDLIEIWGMAIFDHVNVSDIQIMVEV